MAESLHELVSTCAGRLTKLVDSRQLLQWEHQVPQSLWRNECNRFEEWIQNVEADKTGLYSLDYRLREASHTRVCLNQLLHRIQELSIGIRGAVRIFPREDEDDLSPGFGSSPGFGPNPASSSSSSSGSDDGSSTDLAALQIFHFRLADAIGGLNRLKESILHPVPHDRTMDFDVFEANLVADRECVESKYPDADPRVVTRLARGISERRAVLEHRQQHHSHRNSLAHSPNVSHGRNRNHKHPSQSKNKASISSPPPPDFKSNAEFDCPFCFWIISLPNQTEWKRHVFHDLMAYVCVFKNCPGPRGLYESRYEWHRHLERLHGEDMEKRTCPLCNKSRIRVSKFEDHIAKHLEELAVGSLQNENKAEGAAVG
ncbi:uncharacterized protein BDV17DRAFT_288411 [Aspergillus undulatus]|uniref:uncharacterized protein n=1 Tax=Aspergillus undulatus TaxID=1810928 RepID=UPI003CCD915B